MNKNIIFLGSSVTYGDDGWSMCEYVRQELDCNVTKWAVPGTTLADVSDDSYVSRLKKQIDTHERCDCFVCQLSTNDASGDLPLGEISSSKNIDNLDLSTVIGAIEYIISRVTEKWKCPIFFYTGTYMENDKYQTMVDALIELEKKWKFEIIDLWNDPQMRAIDTVEYSKYMKDPVHPNKIGYNEWWGPKFIKALSGILNK
jgi:lysophospholipase L1-like esterase